MSEKRVGPHLADDHEQIHRLLRHGEQMLKSGRQNLAIPLLENFREEILDHMQMEETRFFQPFVQKTGDPDGAVDVMVQQHQRILVLIDSVLARAADEATRGEALEALEELSALLEEHTGFEERTLYAFAASMADERMRAEADFGS